MGGTATMMLKYLMIAAFAAVFCSYRSAYAQEFIPAEAMLPDPGLSYSVKGVAANDLLNVRSQPGVQSELISRLPPDAQSVLVTERRMAEGSSVWWEVIITAKPGGTGWVNHRYLEAQSSEYPQQTDRMNSDQA
jgi:uncharacterized protein YgiM (DUF1202 family)